MDISIVRILAGAMRMVGDEAHTAWIKLWSRWSESQGGQLGEEVMELRAIVTLFGAQQGLFFPKTLYTFVVAYFCENCEIFKKTKKKKKKPPRDPCKQRIDGFWLDRSRAALTDNNACPRSTSDILPHLSISGHRSTFPLPSTPFRPLVVTCTTGSLLAICPIFANRQH